MLDLRACADDDLGDRIGESRFAVQRDVVLDHAHLAAGRCDDQHARMARGAGLRGDEEQVHGLSERGVARHEDDRGVAQEGEVERCEEVVVKPGVAAELRRDGGRVERRERRQVADHDAVAGPGVGAAGQLRNVNAVDEDEPDRRLGDREALDVGRLHGRRCRGPMERLLGERRDAGEAPGLVVRGRQLERADALDGFGAQGLQPRQPAPRGSPC